MRPACSATNASGFSGSLQPPTRICSKGKNATHHRPLIANRRLPLTDHRRPARPPSAVRTADPGDPDHGCATRRALEARGGGASGRPGSGCRARDCGRRRRLRRPFRPITDRPGARRSDDASGAVRRPGAGGRRRGWRRWRVRARAARPVPRRRPSYVPGRIAAGGSPSGKISVRRDSWFSSAQRRSATSRVCQTLGFCSFTSRRVEGSDRKSYSCHVSA